MRFELEHLWSALNLTSFLDINVPPARDVLPGHQSLGTREWKTQLSLPEKIADHWVYLSGNATCPNSTICNEADQAIKAELENHSDLSLSFVDCDAEPILCHSWLLSPPAFMYITVREAQGPHAENNVTMRPISLPIDDASNTLGEGCEWPQDQFACLLNKDTRAEAFKAWDGLFSPFVGTLGKRGGGLVFGYLKNRYSWLPLSSQWYLFGLLLIFRLVIWWFTPSKPPLNPADILMHPGSLAGPGHAKSE